jgi:hypothetical protein
VRELAKESDESEASYRSVQRRGRLEKERNGGSARKKMNSSAATNGSVELDVLDCGICMDPLQPPVFQVRSLTAISLL